jgi:hypothetical protein
MSRGSQPAGYNTASRPLPAQINVGNDALITEMVADGAVSLGKSASAVPQEEGSGEFPVLISAGMEGRGKNQTRMPSVRHSIA